MTVKVGRLYTFRAPGGRIQHVTRDRIVTFCGLEIPATGSGTPTPTTAPTVLLAMCRWCRAAI
jgi:hypothetical protein